MGGLEMALSYHFEPGSPRALALTMRGQAFWGLGRIDDAKAAWRGSAQRYEELGDDKGAAAVNARLGGLDASPEKATADSTAQSDADREAEPTEPVA